jgi:hypothetical protein
MKIEITNLSNEEIVELTAIFDLWKKTKLTSEFNRWFSFFVNVEEKTDIKKSELNIIDDYCNT